MILNNEEIEIIEYKDKYKEKTIQFLMNIAINEFGFEDWQDYFENMDFDIYKEDDSNFWIALNKEDEVVGTIGALKISKNSEVKLNSLYVDKNYRKKGLGKILYTIFLEFAKAKQYKSIILHTYSKFENAIKFYEKNDFNIYEIDEEGFWYRKEIK